MHNFHDKITHRRCAAALSDVATTQILEWLEQEAIGLMEEEQKK
jgi:hypothetical protein